VLHEYVCFTCSESERKVDSCRHLGWPCSLSRTVVGGGPDDPRNTRRERCLVYPPKRKMTRIGSVHGGDGPGSDTLSLLSCRVPSCACFTRVTQEASGRTRSFVACVRSASLQIFTDDRREIYQHLTMEWRTRGCAQEIDFLLSASSTLPMFIAGPVTT
jgi:hypothetical protein